MYLLIASVTRDQAGHAQLVPAVDFQQAPAGGSQQALVAVYQPVLVAVSPRGQAVDTQLVLVAVCPRGLVGECRQDLAGVARPGQAGGCRRAPAADFLQALAIIGDACRRIGDRQHRFVYWEQAKPCSLHPNGRRNIRARRRACRSQMRLGPEGPRRRHLRPAAVRVFSWLLPRPKVDSRAHSDEREGPFPSVVY